jgi:phosphoglycerate dehydrogenase-like enzyme
VTPADDAPRPRLLVALEHRDAIGRELGMALPQLPWGYFDEIPPAGRGDVEAMLVGSFGSEASEFDASTTPRLQFVQRAYTGVDGFPFSRFPERVRVAGNVGAFAPYVSEHAVALALAAARDLALEGEMVRTGRLRPPPEHRLLYGSTAVILGYGAIGTAIAARLAGFGTRVIGLNRTGAPALGCDRMFPADRLREAVAEADFVFEARPLTKRTAQTIDAPTLAAMRSNAVFVNVGRAGTVDEEDLYVHLRDHPAFRAAIDVWWREDYRQGTLSSRFAFAELPNFVGTPHVAGFFPDGEGRAIHLAVENLVRFFREGAPRYVVDRSEYPD